MLPTTSARQIQKPNGRLPVAEAEPVMGAPSEGGHRAETIPRGRFLSVRDGAVEKTRTSTAFRPQRPQRCASTSSATTARHEKGRLLDAAGTGKARPLAKAPEGRNAGHGHRNPVQNGTIPNALFTIAPRRR